jgi:aminomethyltransferase
MEKEDFIGRTALEKAKGAGLSRTLVGLEAVDRGIPRDGYKVLDDAGKEIGYVTSGSYAPFLKKNIALAYVPPSHSDLGHEVFVEIRSQKVKCKIVSTPFYKRPKKA